MSRDNYPQAPDRHHEFVNKGVAIIGAGIGGMLQAIDLLKRGVNNFVLLEKSSNVGGTWLQNQYPGCQCDVASVLYSLSFEQNPLWSREYPGQEEMLDYLIKIASKYNLYRYIRFNSHVQSIRWDDNEHKWMTQVRLAGQDSEHHESYTVASDFLVSAVGQLNQPSYPDIKGMDSFRGKMMHSARWDWSYDIRGKRVAVIGSGATAVQIIPELAPQVAHLTLHQRTPNWVVTRLDAPIPEWRKTLFRWLPFVQHRFRAMYMDFREWTYGFVANQEDVTEIFRQDFFAKLEQSFPNDPAMQEKLTPKYHVGCKRIIVSDDFLPALARPNVRVETDPITKITATGVSVSRGEGAPPSHEEADCIVLATGFRTVEFMHPIEVTGRHGRPLGDIWAGGAHAFNGVTVEDMPNFGILYGPNTNLGHSSIILMEEAQATHIGTLAEAVLDARNTRKTGATAADKGGAAAPAVPLSLVPKKSAVDAYNERLQDALGATAFADPACNSWYKDPRSGKITNNWSHTVVDYQKLLERVVWGDYEGGDVVVGQRGGKDVVVNPRVVEETTLSNPVYLGLGVAGIAAVGTAASLLVRHSRGLSGFLRA